MANEVRVHCPRLNRLRLVSEHLACPYCFGNASDIASGARRRYCDYDPIRDPVVFGFPDDTPTRRGG